MGKQKNYNHLIPFRRIQFQIGADGKVQTILFQPKKKWEKIFLEFYK